MKALLGKIPEVGDRVDLDKHLLEGVQLDGMCAATVRIHRVDAPMDQSLHPSRQVMIRALLL